MNFFQVAFSTVESTLQGSQNSLLLCIVHMLNCGTAVMKIFTAFSVSVGALTVSLVKPHKLVVSFPTSTGLVLFRIWGG